VSKPAQLPPKGTSPWALASHASTEILFVSLSFVVGLALSIAMHGLGLFSDEQTMLVSAVTMAVTGGTYVGIERFLARNDEREVKRLLVESEPVLRSVLIALAGVLVAQAGAAAIALVQTELIGVEAKEQEMIVDLVARGDRGELIALGVTAVVFAPLTEELLFRYMFFRRLVHRAGPVIAFALSALAFSLFHFNPSGVVIYVWLGLVFATTYWLSGRAWVSMLTHAGYNASAFAVLVWAPPA